MILFVELMARHMSYQVLNIYVLHEFKDNSINYVRILAAIWLPIAIT
jgi:hypothetical protein